MHSRFLQALARLLPQEKKHKAATALAMIGIDAAEKSLKSTTATMEARFLSCGSTLEDLTTSGSALVDNSTDLVRLATGRKEAEQIIDSTMAVLEKPLDFLDRYAGSLRQHITSLEEAHDVLGKVLNFEIDLQGVVAPLRATRTMFMVEASRLPESEQAAFIDVAEQIEGLYKQVRDTFSQEFAKLYEIRATLTKLLKRVQTESVQQRQAIETEKAQINEALASLDRQIDQNSTHETHLTERSSTVGSAVSRIIVALQMQDIVAQRTQHLFEGLTKIRTLEPLTEGARIRALADIQSGQAAGALDQLGETSNAVQGSVDEILSTINTLDSDSIFLKEFSEVTASANGTVQVLLDIVEKIREMTASAAALGVDALEHIDPLTSVTTRLSDCVDRLSHQMSLVALNAQIQAIQMGAGTGLEILAAHTANVAAETSRLGEAIREQLERFQTFLNEQIAALTALGTEAGEHGQYMAGEGKEHEAYLHGIRDSILGHLQNIGAAVDAIRVCAPKMAEMASITEPEQTGFEGMRTALSNLSAAVPVNGDAPVELDLEELNYTMASERQNHMKAVGGAVETAGEQETEIELF